MGVDASHLHAGYPTRATLELPLSLSDCVYGAFTLYGASFQRTSTSPRREAYGSSEPHISRGFRPGIRFALCRFRSPLLTASLLLSFPAGTQMLHFPAFPLLTERAGFTCTGFPFGHPGFYGYMRLARAYRSLSRPSSAPEPSHPPGGVERSVATGAQSQIALSQTYAGPQRAIIIIALGLLTRNREIAGLSH